MLRHSYIVIHLRPASLVVKVKDTLFKKTRRLMTETYNVETQRCT